VEKIGYVAGVGACDRAAPRYNLTGDPYFTDGNRAIAVVSGTRTEAAFLEPPAPQAAPATQALPAPAPLAYASG
jgi:hypothetical protein